MQASEAQCHQMVQQMTKQMQNMQVALNKQSQKSRQLGILIEDMWHY